MTLDKRHIKLIVLGVLFIFIVYQNFNNSEKQKTEGILNYSLKNGEDARQWNRPSKGELDDPLAYTISRPETGYVPYEKSFGPGIFNSSGNSFTFKNAFDSDAVVLLVNDNGVKIRNNYIRSGEEFKMIDVPKGRYSIMWLSGSSWSSEKPVGSLMGSFTLNGSLQSSDEELMEVKQNDGWEITLYPVDNGNMRQQAISEEAFSENGL